VGGHLFAQVNVFVGANGARKSCLLEAIGIMGARAAGAVDDQADLKRIRKACAEAERTYLAVERRQELEG
jgi:predicted ATPase